MNHTMTSLINQKKDTQGHDTTIDNHVISLELKDLNLRIYEQSLLITKLTQKLLNQDEKIVQLEVIINVKLSHPMKNVTK